MGDGPNTIGQVLNEICGTKLAFILLQNVYKNAKLNFDNAEMLQYLIN